MNKNLGDKKRNYISYINSGREKSYNKNLDDNNRIIDMTNRKLKHYDELQMKNKSDQLDNHINSRNYKGKNFKSHDLFFEDDEDFYL